MTGEGFKPGQRRKRSRSAWEKRSVAVSNLENGVAGPNGRRTFIDRATRVQRRYRNRSFSAPSRRLGGWTRPLVLIVGAAVVGFGGGVVSRWWPAQEGPKPVVETPVADRIERHFSLCFRGGGRNCVVDGDTLWLDGAKIRVADIDTPETHPPRCAREAELGRRATERLQALLNAGPFSVEEAGDRDTDRYGRQLRVLTRKGDSLGDQLVREGLARPWEGKRRPWCPGAGE